MTAAEIAEAAARDAGLRYVSDERPGIRRKGAGRGFTYTGPDRSRIDDPETLARIRALAIPPAWTDVWICPTPTGHIQATGRDARGRKQYRYHADWRRVRDETKYEGLIEFGDGLSTARSRIRRHLALPGLPREKVLATVVRLLDTTLVRVGNPEYARQNQSFGLTTLRNRHVEVGGGEVRFEFTGKGGKKHAVEVEDPRLARIVRDCLDLPGYDLFQYLDDDGNPTTVESADVNAYLREVTGQEVTAKHFRTWGGTVMAAQVLRRAEPPTSETAARRQVAAAIKEVAQELGNTPAVCRKCYVHPDVIEAYTEGVLLEGLRRSRAAWATRLRELRREEIEVLSLLRKRAARRARAA